MNRKMEGQTYWKDKDLSFHDSKEVEEEIKEAIEVEVVPSKEDEKPKTLFSKILNVITALINMDTSTAILVTILFIPITLCNLLFYHQRLHLRFLHLLRYISS